LKKKILQEKAVEATKQKRRNNKEEKTKNQSPQYIPCLCAFYLVLLHHRREHQGPHPNQRPKNQAQIRATVGY
jgi:hypothetical protein